MPQEGLEIVPAAAPEARASAPKAPAGRVRRKESSPDVEEEPGRKKQVRKRRKHKHRSHHEARAESASPAQEAGSSLPSTGRLERGGDAEAAVVKPRYPVVAAVARLDNLESRMQQAESDLDFTMSTVAKHRNQQLFQLMNDVTAARSKAATECVISGFPTEGTNVEARCAMVQWMCEEAGISNTRMELISQSHCGRNKKDLSQIGIIKMVDEQDRNKLINWWQRCYKKRGMGARSSHTRVASLILQYVRRSHCGIGFEANRSRLLLWP